MQKFTRALTREIEIAGQRLAVTLDAEGLSVRPVGSRKSPQTLTWAACICHLAGVKTATEGQPTEAEVARALEALGSGGASSAGKAEAGSLDETLKAIDQWFRKHRSRFHPALRPGASADDLASLASDLGKPVPDELATLLRWHNGQADDPPGAFRGAFVLLGTTEIAEVHANLDDDPPKGWKTRWIPFMDDDQGNYVVVDPTGVREVWRGRSDHPRVADSLAAWLAEFQADLEAGKYHEDAERGEFHRAE